MEFVMLDMVLLVHLNHLLFAMDMVLELDMMLLMLDMEFVMLDMVLLVHLNHLLFAMDMVLELDMMLLMLDMEFVMLDICFYIVLYTFYTVTLQYSQFQKNN
eukprot:885292_1